MQKPSHLAAPQDAQSIKSNWREDWYRLCNVFIGAIPLPLYVLIGFLILGLYHTDAITNELMIIGAIMMFFGSTCAELGKRLPFFKHVGGGVILAVFLPSYLIYKGWLPKELIGGVQDFTTNSKFIYVFIATVIVGSILGMNRKTLIAGFLKIFVPISLGSLVAGVVGTLTGEILGIGWHKTLFYIVIPIMAGGVGEGAIPLAAGYSEISGIPHGEIMAEILPVIMIGGLTAVFLAALLAYWGKKQPHLTGNGQLTLEGDGAIASDETDHKHMIFDPQAAVAGAMLAVGLYLTGIFCHQVFGLPAPVAMLFLAVVFKLLQAVPSRLEDGAYMVYKFFYVGVTYPLLFAIGVSMTPWDKLMAAFNFPYLATIFMTVISLIATGFLIAKKMKMYPIETAIVNACHSGVGGTGDVAILTAANRMVLMPFAQISTRIGGAVTVTLAIIAFKML
jgi:Na+/citrate or Na+/malate symporter